MSKRLSLYWLNNDLRQRDNLALNALTENSDSIAFLFVFNPAWLQPTNYQHRWLGPHRLGFIIQSLVDLEQQLATLGHTLYILQGDPVSLIPSLVKQHSNLKIGSSRQVGWYEAKGWQAIQEKLPAQSSTAVWNNTLYAEEMLLENQLFSDPLKFESFSKFRHRVENSARVTTPIQKQPAYLPSQLQLDGEFITARQLQASLQAYHHNPCIPKATNTQWHDLTPSADETFSGGEQSAQRHLSAYFNSSAPSRYKETRNELEGWKNSTKFSPFLAAGNLSARQIWAATEQYEKEQVKNDSTYWIKFELLWREYFHWLALKQATRLYRFRGLSKSQPLTSYYAERLQKWCSGNTPYPLVNACMNQLNRTGFLSNRGRQIAASCLVNELRLDWRYGAAYFQQQLIDHDVASNWGNWQYIAGVGVDPRGGRHFNIEKQTEHYDPNGEYISRWQGDASQRPLDSNDAADWPVASPQPIEGRK